MMDTKKEYQTCFYSFQYTYILSLFIDTFIFCSKHANLDARAFSSMARLTQNQVHMLVNLVEWASSVHRHWTSRVEKHFPPMSWRTGRTDYGGTYAQNQWQVRYLHLFLFGCTCAHIISCFKSRYQNYICMFNMHVWTFNPRLASTWFKQKYGSFFFFSPMEIPRTRNSGTPILILPIPWFVWEWFGSRL